MHGRLRVNRLPWAKLFAFEFEALGYAREPHASSSLLVRIQLGIPIILITAVTGSLHESLLKMRESYIWLNY